MRMAGYQATPMGPKTEEAVRNFGVKLAKALYYKHTKKILDGEILMLSGALARGAFTPDGLAAMLKIAPFEAQLQRGDEDLRSQFIYRFNYKDVETPILYAVTQFSDQLIYAITALSAEFLSDPAVAEQWAKMPADPWPFERIVVKRQHWLV